MNDYTTSAGGWGGGEGVRGGGRARSRDVLLQIGRVSRRCEFGFLVRGENRRAGCRRPRPWVDAGAGVRARRSAGADCGCEG